MRSIVAINVTLCGLLSWAVWATVAEHIYGFVW